MLNLSHNQFGSYARSLAAIAIEAHLEALRSFPDNQQIAGRIEGICWLADLLGIELDPDPDPVGDRDGEETS